MPHYNAPIRDMQFLLHEVLRIDRFANLPPYQDADRETVDAILDEAGKFASIVIAPLNRVGDLEGCIRHDDASVSTPTGFKEAYKVFCDSGFLSLCKDPAFGGQGLGQLLYTAVVEMLGSANHAFSMYPGLTAAAWTAIYCAGSEEQKQTYLPKMTTGEWSGAMDLTESQCGTDLGLMSTKAVPQTDGSYKISGQKTWISSGEHDLTENIIHLVLARIQGAPEGIKGISLFIAPKFLVDTDGELGERNKISCGGLEEKMGIHGNSTCVMNYDEASGYLVGEPNAGMRGMFLMMNEVRLGTGVQGFALSEVAYQNAVAFARERRQGRSLTGPQDINSPADSILVHPDVRRMLLDVRCFTEGARAFAYWLSLQQDIKEHSPDEATRQKAKDYLALLTPVIKAYFTNKGLSGTIDSQQVLGGAGYCEEWGMSQFVRDLRISSIYEGTNGVQALDLVGRKLTAEGGRYWQSYFAELDEVIAQNEGDSTLAGFVEGLQQVKSKLTEATQWIAVNGKQNPNNAAAASHDYLHLFGLTGLTHMWVLMAKAASEKASGDQSFYVNKLATCRYFLDRVLPEGESLLLKIKAGSTAIMALDDDAF
jgi:alkylation response protein AidB-like acyl-CoA dehydrogenase